MAGAWRRRGLGYAGRVAIVVALAVLVGRAWAQVDPAPPPKLTPAQWSLVAIPDPQAYTETYGAAGHLYDGRFDKQTEWIAANVETLNIRFVSDMGDNVQNFARNPGEWTLAVRALNLLHRNHDPDQAAVVPYAVCCGNHDYDSNNMGSLVSTFFEKNLGPGRFRDAQGKIKDAVREWYGGDDLDWEYVVGGKTAAKGVGRNSWQTFTAGGREFLHLTLETAVTDEGIAWAKTILAAHAGTPTIVSTHAFIDGGKAAGLRVGNRMGRLVTGGPNPTNDAPMMVEKLLAENDQIFLVLCGHTWMQAHRVIPNAKGHDVHVLEQCYHLNASGGRVYNAQKPAGGWPSGWTGPDDTQRNGSCWLTVLVFDPPGKTITRYTYSPLLGMWATDRAADPGNRTFPVGDDVIEQFKFDFDERFGPAGGR